MKPRSSFKDIKAEIARRIGARVWPPGALIPGEETLAEEFGSARATVNRALRELAADGLIERRRKAGTRVALHPVRSARFAIPLVRHEIEARGAAYEYRLIESTVGPAPEPVGARLHLPASAQTRHVRALHLADGRPCQYEDRHICLDTVPEAAGADLSAVGANEWLVENAPFSRAEFAFLAENAGAGEAEFLGIRRGAAVLVAERVTWLAERPITLVRMIHPPDYRMVTAL